MRRRAIVAVLGMGLAALVIAGPDVRPAVAVAAAGGSCNVVADVVASGRAGRVLVDLGEVRADLAPGLAAALPEWEEAIAAGTRELLLTADEVEDLRRRGFPVRAVASAPPAPLAWPGCYRTLDETYRWAAEMAERYPALIELLDIGDSHCKARGGCRTPGGQRIAGRDILVARLTAQGSPAAGSGRLWIDGGLHAREIPSMELMTAFIGWLTAGYGSDAQVTYLLDHREVYVGLSSNPDGRELVELGTRPANGGRPWSWRKNGHDLDGSCPWPPKAEEHFGVDLNRNHDFKWQAGGASTDPCDSTYRGPRPVSEPETEAYEAFVRTILPDQRGPDDEDVAPLDTTGLLINFHNATMPGTVLLPWGWTTAAAPNGADLAAIAARYAAFAGYGYRQALYAVSGNTRDWAYGELGVPAYVVELEGREFFTPCADLPDVLDGQRAPLLWALALADRPYERVRGPEAVELGLPDAVHAGEVVSLTATFDDGVSGGEGVAGAEVTIGRPGGVAAAAALPDPAVAPGGGLAMDPADGAFDAVLEEAVFDLTTAGLTAGRYVVVVRGIDAAGHWGPGRAAFLTLLPPPTATASPTPSATGTPTATPTATATATASPTFTPTATDIATPTATATATATPTGTATPTPTPRALWVPHAGRGSGS